ncbi:helix-turn-helix domain-containing protein [Thalassospira sp.]|uniref:helix-turn-helix domain-containing protein n=1 Tax=Thalassospira sp. TaxID=1912094 RepID=UPI003AA88DF7
MVKSQPIAHETLQAVFTAAFRRVVGTYQNQNKAVTLAELARRTGIKGRTLEAYRDGETLPSAINLVRIQAALPASFTNEIIALAGFGNAKRMSGREIDLHGINAQVAEFVATHAQHMADGRLDHMEIALEIDLAAAIHSLLGDFLAATGTKSPVKPAGLSVVGSAKAGAA